MILFNIISILLTLGTTPDCDGYGMCILEQRTEANQENCLKYDNCLPADMGYEDGVFELSISHKSMKDAVYIKHFTTENFRVDKDIRIPDDIAQGLGCPIGTVIPVGKYPIYEEGGRVVVRIKL